MTKEQAVALVEQVQREAPGAIEATIEHAGTSIRGYGVRMLHKRIGRVQTARYTGDWTAIKESWYWFLFPDEEPEEVPPAPDVRYLVDGVPMYITFGKDGYWRGLSRRNGKMTSKYFGKVDPRPRYPVMTQESEML